LLKMARSTLLVLLLAIPVIYASWTLDELSPLVNIKAEFERFKSQYGRNYSSDAEEHHRFTVFSQNLVKAMNLNSGEENGGAVFGITKFMDLTASEFKEFKGYVPSATRGVPTVEKMTPSAFVASPCSGTYCDWRTAGAVTAVKNQGQCGSCWAFSATEGLESGWFLGGHALVALSPQQLVSCDKVDSGCDGGDLPTAYKYIEDTGGLESNAQYPYTSGGGGNTACKFNAKSIVASMQGWSYAIPPCYGACTNQNEGDLQQAVAQYGPSSICVNAESWQFYNKGILKSACPSAYSKLDHCVQLVGYSSQGAVKYWIIKNSWAADWGEQGYIYIQIGKNLCGVADEATFVKA